MKKFYLLFLVAFVALLGFKANADTYTVAGSSDVLLGSSWDPTNTANDMTESNGVWTLVKENVTLGQQTIEYKVCLNHGWDTSYGDNGNNAQLVISESGIYNVTFTFVQSSGAVSAEAVKQGSAVVTTDYFLVGAFNGWTQKDDNYKFTNEADGTHKLENVDLTAGEFKFMDSNGSWYGDGATVAGSGDITFSGGNGNNNNLSVAGNYSIVLDPANNKATFTLNGGEPDPAYYLIGEVNSWDEDNMIAFTNNEGVFTLTQTFNGLFKIKDENGNWLGAAGDENPYVLSADRPSVTLADGNNMSLEDEAEYTLTIENGVLTVAGFPETPVVEPYATVYIDKASVEGNLYAYDSEGEYAAWVGTAITDLETGEKDGVEYYVFEFNHENASEPVVIFNNGESGEGNQTENISVADGDVLKYLGGESYELNGVEYPEEIPVTITAVELRGTNSWDAALAEFTLDNPSTGYMSAEAELAANDEVKIYVSYSDGTDKWLRMDANDLSLNKANLEQGEFDLVEGDGNMIVVVPATYTFTVNPALDRLIISAEITREFTLHHGHDGQNDWKSVDMTANEDVFTVEEEFTEGEVFYFTDEFGTYYPDMNAANDQIYGLHKDWKEAPLAAEGHHFFQMNVASTFTITLDASAETISVEGWPAETRVIEGVVLDDKGEPLEGVTVTANVKAEPNTNEGARRLLDDPTYTTTTGADGSYSLEVPADNEYTLTFAKDGYSPVTVDENAAGSVEMTSVVSGIESILAGENVVAVKYVNVTGQVSEVPFRGVNIVVVNYSDGTSKAIKVLK